MVKLNKTDEQVIAALKEGGELTLQELSGKTGESSKKVFRSLRKLFEKELIETNARKYKLSTKSPTASKEDETELPE
jgi:predicted transcriptional regulator